MSGKLSNRQKQIIQILLNEQDYISASMMSDQLNVSRRTVLRELSDVEHWLESHGAFLSKITGKGMALTANEEQLQILKQAVDHEKVEMIYTPSDRQRKIMLELLNATEPKKIYYFSSLLNVSEATISYDLDKIEEWLAAWQLTLLRKPGYGIVVEGHESSFRKAIMQLFNDYFDRGELLYLLRDDYIDSNTLMKKTSIRQTLLDVVGYRFLEAVEIAVKASGVLDGYPLADSAYASLIIHLSLVVKRLSEGGTIHFDANKMDELKDSREFALGAKIADQVSEAFQINIPDEEIGYIALHIQGSRIRMNKQQELEIRVQNYEVIYLVEKLIKEVESITGYMLVENRHLLSGLVNHFGPALARMRQGLEIKNPLKDEMKTRYAFYFNSIKQAVKIIEEQLNIEIEDDETAYLTMHFAAAVESIKKVAYRSWRVVVVCSTGIGSSKLLEARLIKQFKNMHIIGVTSSIDVHEFYKEDVDLFISTIQLKDEKYPHVVVSPLLLEEDIRKVENALSNQAPLRAQSIKVDDGLNYIQLLNEMSTIIEISLQLLNNFFILESKSDQLDEMITTAVEFIDASGQDDILISAFKEREEKGTTWFDQQQGRLLHCQSDAVSEVYFGFIVTPTEKYAAVMVGYRKLSVQVRQLLGQISLNLMENKHWLNEVKAKDLTKAYNTLEKILKDYLFDVMQTGGRHEK